ncbi:MAG: endonuclease/exonuclease/phosphatase family protein [Acidobacteriota bacterium]|nr:endonuclease/exonuclease/phosphatase family protein [Blastocatellia bacterium]MDW8411247.1 endonuclease/exonuclease/phosphatase family protein [Acidobacteriota bacterium]
METIVAEERLIVHRLKPYFAELARCQSSKELLANPLYQRLRPEIEAVLNSYEVLNRPDRGERKSFYRAVAWNIERGICFDAILEELKTNSLLRRADLLLLTETDLGMARSQNRNVARELALALDMNYYFVPAYINLCKGSGIESDFEGENDYSLHGNSILSRYPLRDLQAIPLKNAKDKMRGKEKRIGRQQALAATVDFPQGSLRAVCVHLDALSTQRQRRQQMETILKSLKADPGMPVLLGGDLNTSTYNSRHAFYAICGFWYRVFMGAGNVIANHYPYPERYFERGLFELIEQMGYDFKNCNELGVGTVHFRTSDFKKNKNLRDWVPEWCFAFIEWALRPYGGKCSLKLDWFATKGLKVIQERDNLPAATPPKVLSGLNRDGNEISDHDPIILDFVI